MNTEEKKISIYKSRLVEAGGIEETPSQDSILRTNNNFLPSLGHFTEIIYHKNVRGHIVPLRGFILPPVPPPIYFHLIKVEKHPGKTFIGRIAKGFDFLGYSFEPKRLSIAPKTLANFMLSFVRFFIN